MHVSDILAAIIFTLHILSAYGRGMGGHGRLESFFVYSLLALVVSVAKLSCLVEHRFEVLLYI